MIALIVDIHVQPDAIADFKQAAITNAKHSLLEPGIARFDFIQQQDDPTRFMLIEVYATEQDVLKHKETDHYNTWRETVEPMMAEPRKGVRHDVIHPDPSEWWPK